MLMNDQNSGGVSAAITVKDPKGIATGTPGAPLQPQRKPVIGADQVRKADKDLQRYKDGKKSLDDRIIENEQWFKLRHWDCMKGRKSEIRPTSAWLLNSLMNKHADAMDNYPEPNVRPREEGDQEEAKVLTSIIPVILEQNDFEQVYSDVMRYKGKAGTGVFGVFWDGSKLNGLGDIVVKKIDLLNLYWEPGVTNIQESRNLFHLELQDNEVLEERYPQLKEKLGNDTGKVSRYYYDDNVDTKNKSCVVDWYYKKPVGRQSILHYCKYVNDIVLYSSENDPKYAERGWYEDGDYPFVFDVGVPVEGSPAGYGYMDVGKDAQAYIDRANQAIMENMLENSSPRYLYRQDCGINPEDYADQTKRFVPVTGNLDETHILPIQGKPLSSIYLTVQQGWIDSLKETTGNRDVSNGGTTGGVTAASGLAAMQEAGSKLSRDDNKGSYRAFRRLCLMIIERIRQFYDMPRKFRILGEDGKDQFLRYDNSRLKVQPVENYFGAEPMYRKPLFDIEVTAQKASPYSKVAQNELAIQLFQLGVFNPQMVDQALALLDIMDFSGKQFVIDKVRENGTMFQQMQLMMQQMMMLAQIVDKHEGSNIAQQLAAQFSGGQPVAPVGGGDPIKASETEALGGEDAKESSTTKKARQRVAESTSPT